MSGAEKKVLDFRPIFGLRATITTPAAATDGAYFEIDDVLEPVERGTAVQVKPPQMLLRGLAFIGRRLGYRLE